MEITRAHDLISSAVPSSSVHSSQEDLTACEDEECKRPVIADVSKLRQDQVKTMRRAKELLAAAFSEEEDSDAEEEVEVQSFDDIGGKDSDMH